MGKYEDALERASKLYEEFKAMRHTQAMADLEEIFHELRESEDERIINAIIGILKNSNAIDINVSQERMFAWLEKIKEKSAIPDDLVKCYKEFGEKIDGGARAVINALNGYKEWSKEDDEMLNWLCRIIHSKKNQGELSLEEESLLGDWIDKWINHGPQPKQEWSEEDETGLQDALWCISKAEELAKDENDMGNIWYADHWLKTRLKFLRPQPHWKPSEEQMKCLLNAEGLLRTDKRLAMAQKLAELYEQLKKLL